jgi:hypothetical protein
VLEGDFSSGKTDLLNVLLRYLQIPHEVLSTDPKLADAQLLEAYQQGKRLIINELNGFFREQRLNTLLSEKPPKAGFFILATQNKISAANRQPLPKPLENRLAFINVDAYSPQQLLLLAQKKPFCLEDGLAAQRVRQFQQAQQEAARLNYRLPSARIFFSVIQADAGSSRSEDSVRQNLIKPDRLKAECSNYRVPRARMFFRVTQANADSSRSEDLSHKI